MSPMPKTPFHSIPSYTYPAHTLACNSRSLIIIPHLTPQISHTFRIILHIDPTLPSRSKPGPLERLAVLMVEEDDFGGDGMGWSDAREELVGLVGVVVRMVEQVGGCRPPSGLKTKQEQNRKINRAADNRDDVRETETDPRPGGNLYTGTYTTSRGTEGVELVVDLRLGYGPREVLKAKLWMEELGAAATRELEKYRGVGKVMGMEIRAGGEKEEKGWRRVVEKGKRKVVEAVAREVVRVIEEERKG
ncbi:hypothetical protein EX30DRAFT_362895 [Ascodesmis nigricans]|uniref:Uncharacterized protein n=1 Tax=Ascodesmis nigricans TaxID=341454 RepID=A0A4V3SJC1_9PEZI|nr:hypothetical protein EX30DRAFT_362895 [Ascodesmis nigricans]